MSLPCPRIPIGIPIGNGSDTSLLDNIAAALILPPAFVAMIIMTMLASRQR